MTGLSWISWGMRFWPFLILWTVPWPRWRKGRCDAPWRCSRPCWESPLPASTKQLPPIHMGIGLHAGEVVAGHIGSESRAKYGIIGSAVNLAHRIQGQARGGEVVISAAVYQMVQAEVNITRKFEVRLKGIQEPVALYVIKGLAPP